LRREFEVYTAQSGAQALEILKRQPVHVIMTDQRMPGMTGVELLSRIPGACAQAMRIIFTGYADLKAVIDAINRGQIYRYLTKPWDPDELEAVLQQACAQYDQIAERQRVLSELRSHVAQGLALVQGLREGQYGTLNPAGQAEGEQFAQAGQALHGRLERVLA